MLSLALSWIPVIGPIVQGITSVFNGLFNKEIAFRKADVSEAGISAEIIRNTNDDIGIRLLRDLCLVGPVVWSLLISWDTIIGARKVNGSLWHPWAESWMFHVGSYPDTVGYIPYAALVFLLGNIGLNMWNRK